MLILGCPRRTLMPWDLRAEESPGPERGGAVPKFTQQVSGQDQDGGRLSPGTVRTGYVGAVTLSSALNVAFLA